MTDVAIKKAELWEIKPDKSAGKKVLVQFNPETLKVSFSNQIVPPTNNNTAAPAGGNQPAAPSIQYVGQGTTKLAVQLWFDVTGVLPQEKTGETDVRQLTKEVAYFITPQADPNDKTKFLPPGVRFLWGTFQFDGIMDSLEESLEFFSADGKPLRASLSLSMSQQEIEYQFAPAQAGNAGGPGGGGPGNSPGTRPLAQAAAGMSLQGMADNVGKGANWQGIAAANNIENPRFLAPGQLVDLNVSTDVGIGIGASAGASIG